MGQVMSRKFHLNKLVRDGIVPSMLNSAQQPENRKLSESELRPALIAKIIEEAGECDLPDLLEVVETLAKLEGKTFKEVREAQLTKRAKLGGYSEGVYIGALILKDNDPWVDYYAADPDRFPETLN